MKIIIDENENVFLNGEKIENNKINSEFLESVVDFGLKSELQLELKGDVSLPMIKLFSDIQDMLKLDSDFRVQLEKIKKANDQIKTEERTEEVARELVFDENTELEDMGF